MAEVITIVQERLPHHPLLGRNIRVDSRSLAYPFDASGITLVTTKHKRNIGPLDQGQLGSCTGNAFVGNMACEPFFSTLSAGMPYSLTEDGAVKCYSDATRLDTYPGSYPPDDTGSDGTAVAQAGKNGGMISGYVHATNGPDARAALVKTPIMIGVKWWNNMFTFDADGRVRVDRSSGLAGGHEISAEAIVVEEGKVWLTQSWGPSFGVTFDGVPGRFYLTFDDFDGLIEDQGDATVMVPLSQKPPVPVPPTPVPPPAVATDADLWAASAYFRQHRHWLHPYRDFEAVLTAWGTGKGFTL